MNYKTNTPNYKTKRILKYDDFGSDLYDLERGYNLNHRDTQKYVKNSKYRLNPLTGKLDDLTLDEVKDKLKSKKDK